jgi:regulator of sirC expression with transglutaminase-like and TPR domain
MDVAARWERVVQRPSEDVALDEAALLISAAANPDLDMAVELRRLDAIAGRLDHPDTDSLCRLLFGELGWRGDPVHYDDPANSYIDQVMARGKGIPISLSVLLMEIGRRAGLRYEAVGMPGHFLVRDPSRPEELIDAFGGGRRLGVDGCQELLRAVAGPEARLRPAMLATTGTHLVLARMLLNLDHSFERRDDRASLAWVAELRRRLPGAAAGDRMQLATRLATLGRFDSAADVLDELDVEGEAGERLTAEALSLRARLN